MERIDKIEFAIKTLKDIRKIYDNGFNKEAHSHIWTDLHKIISRIDVLTDVLEMNKDD